MKQAPGQRGGLVLPTKSERNSCVAGALLRLPGWPGAGRAPSGPAWNPENPARRRQGLGLLNPAVKEPIPCSNSHPWVHVLVLLVCRALTGLTCVY